MSNRREPSPLLIATIGMDGSASTWVFNVVRELMIDSVGSEQVLSLYADELRLVPIRMHGLVDTSDQVPPRQRGTR